MYKTQEKLRLEKERREEEDLHQMMQTVKSLLVPFGGARVIAAHL